MKFLSRHDCFLDRVVMTVKFSVHCVINLERTCNRIDHTALIPFKRHKVSTKRLIIRHYSNYLSVSACHWRIRGGTPGTPPPVQMLSFLCSFQQNIRLAYLSRELAFPKENPGSAFILCNAMWCPRTTQCEPIPLPMMHWTSPSHPFWDTGIPDDPGPSRVPMLLTSGSHHWKPIQPCSLDDPIPPLLLTPSGHWSTYGWQAGGTHPTGCFT